MTVIHKQLDEILVAYMRIHGKYTDIHKTLATIDNACHDLVIGDPIVVHHWLVQDKNGHDMDVCIHVSKPIEIGQVKSMTLEKCEAMTAVHSGSLESIFDTYRLTTKETYIHGLPIAESGREVYLHFDPENPEDNKIEVQEVLHDWDNRFSKQLQAVLGDENREKVLQCYEGVSYKSSLDERFNAVKCAMDVLDEVATEDQKFEVLSKCAHVFPPELIAAMREVYVETGDVDAVLEAMKQAGNYPTFARKGNVLYSSKEPANKVAYEKATTRKEKMQAYCFCPTIRHNLDEVSSTFCYCGSGWARRLWEGILARPVKVEIVESLTKGDDQCSFAVHLPE